MLGGNYLRIESQKTMGATDRTAFGNALHWVHGRLRLCAVRSSKNGPLGVRSAVGATTHFLHELNHEETGKSGPLCIARCGTARVRVDFPHGA